MLAYGPCCFVVDPSAMLGTFLDVLPGTVVLVVPHPYMVASTLGLDSIHLLLPYFVVVERVMDPVVLYLDVSNHRRPVGVRLCVASDVNLLDTVV